MHPRDITLHAMKILLPLLVCVVLVSGCASTPPKAETPDPVKVALEKAKHELSDTMTKLIAPEQTAPVMGNAQTIVAFDTPAN